MPGIRSQYMPEANLSDQIKSEELNKKASNGSGGATMPHIGAMLASPVLNVVLKQIGAAIGGQIKLQKDFSKDLRNMKMTLESVAAVLEDAERQSIEDDAVQLWLKRLKNAMYDISNMLDELEADTQPAERKMSLKNDLLQLASMMQCCVAIGPRITLANRMKGMRDQLKEITDQHKSFTLRTGPSSNQVKITDARETSSTIKDQQLIVGRSSEKRDIMACLSNSATGKITIFPIYGIGGIGKTTLAKMVFNDAQFTDYTRVWVYVSQTFDLNKIGNSIISQLSKRESQLTERQMIHTCLVDQLAGKNILIVLDDLWEDNGSLLDGLRDMLIVDEDKRLVVIVTTRNEGIADRLHTVKPYKLAPLSDDSCWTIIKQKSDFEKRDDKQQLEHIGKGIAMKCGGVALAAQSLGHMLKPLLFDEWESVMNSNIWNVPASKNAGEVLSSLRLSYTYMPSHLKLCFAYCGIFPKGHRFAEDDLIYQWNSLGFVEEPDMFSTRQLGEQYIRQLMGLSFLQPSSSHNSANGVHHEHFMHLTMHDLVRDLARLVLVDELILGVTRQGNTEASSCRYALLDDCSKKLELYTDFPSKIKALRYLDCGKIGLQEDAFSSAKYLRVLDLRECSIQKLPDSIGELKQLRYLNAPHVQHQMIPNSITKLLKLIYLSLSGSAALSALPDSIGEMEGLMYLDLSGCSGLEKLPDSFDKLKQLVHLDLSNCSNLMGVSESLQRLTNLEYLNLQYCWNITELPEHFGSIVNLKYLNISGCVEIQELPRSFGSLKNLMHLDLSHCSGVNVVPEILENLTKLQYLNLSHCGGIGRNRVAEALGNLTQLRHLYLSGVIDSISQDISTIFTLLERISALSNLEHLDLSCTEGLTCLPECIGRLSKLCTLDICDCSSLLSLPESIVQMDSLQMIYAKNCSSFVTQFARCGSEFVVHIDELKGSKLSVFHAVNTTMLTIRGLEKVKSVEEVQSIKLIRKQEIKQLKLVWGRGNFEIHEGDTGVLGCPVPPITIETLSIDGYNGTMLPEWLTSIHPYSFPNLISVSFTDLPNCCSLPPLGQLANLKTLHLASMRSVEKIDEDFCGGSVAFPRLESFTLSFMDQLEVWNTMYSYRGDGLSRYMFPCLRKLEISYCPKLRMMPCPPKSEEWIINASDGVISSWGASTSHASVSSSSSPQCTTLNVYDCNVPLHQWRLLYHLPGLTNLEMSRCRDLTSSPEIIKAMSSVQCLSLDKVDKAQLQELLGHLTSLKKLTMSSFETDALQQVAKLLTSLQSLRLSYCLDRMTALPPWVGDLTSLQRLKISNCNSLTNMQEIMGCHTSLRKLDIRSCLGIESLPDDIQQLTKLEKLKIIGCGPLERWCKSEDNKMKLAYIKVKIIGTGIQSGMMLVTCMSNSSFDCMICSLDGSQCRRA